MFFLRRPPLSNIWMGAEEVAGNANYIEVNDSGHCLEGNYLRVRPDFWAEQFPDKDARARCLISPPILHCRIQGLRLRCNFQNEVARNISFALNCRIPDEGERDAVTFEISWMSSGDSNIADGCGRVTPYPSAFSMYFRAFQLFCRGGGSAGISVGDPGPFGEIHMIIACSNAFLPLRNSRQAMLRSSHCQEDYF
jgi:hypothetical protein